MSMMHIVCGQEELWTNLFLTLQAAVSASRASDVIARLRGNLFVRPRAAPRAAPREFSCLRLSSPFAKDAL